MKGRSDTLYYCCINLSELSTSILLIYCLVCCSFSNVNVILLRHAHLFCAALHAMHFRVARPNRALLFFLFFCIRCITSCLLVFSCVTFSSTFNGVVRLDLALSVIRFDAVYYVSQLNAAFISSGGTKAIPLLFCMTRAKGSPVVNEPHVSRLTPVTQHWWNACFILPFWSADVCALHVPVVVTGSWLKVLSYSPLEVKTCTYQTGAWADL